MRHFLYPKIAKLSKRYFDEKLQILYEAKPVGKLHPRM